VPAAEPPTAVQPAPPPEPPAVATAPTQPSDDLAALRAEVAALQQRARQPELEPPAPAEPAKPAHPLEAHAKQVLGPGAQPHHVERAVELLDQGMQWQRVLDHHAANPTPSSAAEVTKARRAMATLQQQVEDIAERARLHAQIAELRGAHEKPKPEQRMQQRAQVLDSVLADHGPQAMGMHPNLSAAMQADPKVAEQVKAHLMRLPDDEHFIARGNEVLHMLDRAYAGRAQAAPAPAPSPPPAVATPAPTKVQPQEFAGAGAPLVSRQDFWSAVHNGIAAKA
jgi:hypothetical protein